MVSGIIRPLHHTNHDPGAHQTPAVSHWPTSPLPWLREPGYVLRDPAGVILPTARDGMSRARLLADRQEQRKGLLLRLLTQGYQHTCLLVSAAVRINAYATEVFK